VALFYRQANRPWQRKGAVTQATGPSALRARGERSQQFLRGRCLQRWIPLHTTRYLPRRVRSRLPSSVYFRPRRKAYGRPRRLTGQAPVIAARPEYDCQCAGSTAMQSSAALKFPTAQRQIRRVFRSQRETFGPDGSGHHAGLSGLVFIGQSGRCPSKNLRKTWP